MQTSKIWERTALAALLLLELWAFSGSFDKFFNLDSLFYIIHAPRSWPQMRHYFLAPDDARQYRPLTLAFMGPAVRILGTDPRPSHWIPLLFHLANTVLFYCLASRLLKGSLAVLFATAFWGLHSVVGWVTYDITCLSDFLLAFLFLSSLILAIDGTVKKSRTLIAGSLVLFIIALLTKEAGITFPLALWISLALAELRRSNERNTLKEAGSAFKKAVPLTALYLLISAAQAMLLGYFLRSGQLYAQGSGLPYDINLFSNLWAKTKYFFWAFNLPDALHLDVRSPGKYGNLALAGMGLLLVAWMADMARRRGKLSPVEYGGLIWLVGMNMPALLLANRLAKWYLYVPLLGLALALGFGVQNLRYWVPRWEEKVATPLILCVATAPILFSTVVQTRSYLNASDSSYVSDVLHSCLNDFRQAHPLIPSQVTLFILPSFEPSVTALLAAPPIDGGQLFELYYPGSQIQPLFAHKDDPFPRDFAARSDVFVLHYLDGRLYDVSKYYRQSGRMTLFVLPTAEAKIPPLLEKEPTGGRKLYDSYVQLQIADQGAQLPEDYFNRPDYCIVQYLNGHFYDVTDYYKGRKRDSARRVIRDIKAVDASVSRVEYYPDYKHFDTPNGGPVFFPTPQKEIFTQIGGSTAILPPVHIPPGSSLRFDISWMYDSGDGGWAELRVRAAAKELTLYKEYMKPNGKGSGFHWKEVRLDLHAFENQEAEIVLRCFNDRRKNTVSDWLNWRDIVIETPK